MEVKEWPIEEVKPYKNNPRNNDDAVEATANSIREFGWQQPIVVDTDGVIIVGHTRLKAAKKLKLKQVPVTVAENLTDEQVKAYRLADNKTGELAVWDKTLQAELDDIYDIDMTIFGFDPETEDEEETPLEPEVEFTPELLEKNNYVVLTFDNDVDWLQAQTLLGLKTVKSLDSKPNFEKKGIGRVVDGASAINNIINGGENIED
jgi:ParB-like chromosome segregation protein Spo0J